MDEFRVKLRWIKSAQFAGFFAAEALGYWEHECLRVTLLNPENDDDKLGRITTSGSPHAAIPWYLAHQQQYFSGDPVLRVSQYFRRSAIRWFTSPVFETNKTRGLKGFADIRGLKWCLPRGLAVHPFILALIRKFNITACNYADPLRQGDIVSCVGNEDLEFSACGFGIDEILGLEPDNKAHLMHGMVYNQIGQLLAYKLDGRLLVMGEDFLVFNPEEDGDVVFVEDGITVNKTWVDQGGNSQILVRFLKVGVLLVSRRTRRMR